MRYYVIDKTLEQEHLKTVRHCVETTEIAEDADAILVIGGDGAMLHAIDRHQRLGKPFIGAHAGTRGYLMNNTSHPEAFFHRLAEVEYETVWMLEGVAETTEGSKTVYGFNDIWVERATGQTLRMRVSVNGEQQPPLLVGDGILCCTPQGSTGYNSALRGKAVSPGVPILQLTPICCVVNKTPLGSVIFPDDVELMVDFEQIDKRPGRLLYDGIEMPGGPIQRLTFRKSDRAVKLGFIREYSFRNKVLTWQFQT